MFRGNYVDGVTACVEDSVGNWDKMVRMFVGRDEDDRRSLRNRMDVELQNGNVGERCAIANICHGRIAVQRMCKEVYNCNSHFCCWRFVYDKG